MKIRGIGWLVAAGAALSLLGCDQIWRFAPAARADAASAERDVGPARDGGPEGDLLPAPDRGPPPEVGPAPDLADLGQLPDLGPDQLIAPTCIEGEACIDDVGREGVCFAGACCVGCIDQPFGLCRPGTEFTRCGRDGAFCGTCPANSSKPCMAPTCPTGSCDTAPRLDGTPCTTTAGVVGSCLAGACVR